MPRWWWLVAIVCCVVSLSASPAESDFAGTWQGETVSGRRVVLSLAVTGSRATGTFTLDKSTVPIADGKIVDRTCSFRVSIDGRTPAVSGELLRDRLTLSVEGVPNPVLLRRVK
jgi:hypothetical protein